MHGSAVFGVVGGPMRSYNSMKVDHSILSKRVSDTRSILAWTLESNCEALNLDRTGQRGHVLHKGT